MFTKESTGKDDKMAENESQKTISKAPKVSKSNPELNFCVLGHFVDMGMKNKWLQVYLGTVALLPIKFSQRLHQTGACPNMAGSRLTGHAR